jgi:hypothetical protein
VAKRGQTKAEAEKVKQYEDRLDNVLFECMEIMKRPEKWAIDRQGNFTIVYPHPIVNREANRIEGVKYLPHKSYYLPDVLLERQRYWEDLIKGTKVKDGERKPYTKVTPAMVAEILRLIDRGLAFTKIAKQVGVSDYSVKKYTTQHQEQTEAVAN